MDRHRCSCSSLQLNAILEIPLKLLPLGCFLHNRAGSPEAHGAPSLPSASSGDKLALLSLPRCNLYLTELSSASDVT